MLTKPSNEKESKAYGTCLCMPGFGGEYCEEEKLKVSGFEKLYKEENIFEFENKIIARFAMFTKLPLMIEMYLDGSITLFFNLYECDPLTAAVLTKKLCEEQNVNTISSFVEMKNTDGELQKLLFGQEAVEQYTQERFVDPTLSPHMN